MTINDMRYVLKIAETGSFTRAAEALFISQPSLSQRLQKVETELGIRLFDRNRFGEVSPTAAGKRFCSECSHILAHWTRLENELTEMKGKKSMTLGIPVRTGYEMVAGLMDALAEEAPNISLNLVDCPNYRMEELIAKGEMDLGLLRMPTPGLGLKMRMLFGYAPAVRLRAGSPLADKVYRKEGETAPYIGLSELEHEPLVAAPSAREHRTRVWLEALFGQVPGLRPRVVHTVPNIKMYEHFAKTGTASYVIPLQEIPEGFCRLEPELALPYNTFLVQSDRADPEAADLIFRILKRLTEEGISSPLRP